MSVTRMRLRKIFQFLTDNRDWNQHFQDYEYRRRLAYCAAEPNPRQARLQELLRGTAATQSMPSMRLLSPFWQCLNEFEAKGINSMEAFTEHLAITKSQPEVLVEATRPLERLYMELKKREGWGGKTAALFVKNVIRIHQGPVKFHFWKDASKLCRGSLNDDCVYLPVDRVIEEIFRALGMKRPTFKKINELLHTHYDSDEMIVWDDLWFWGFFTQVVVKPKNPKNSDGKETPSKRLMKWNEEKFWCQITTQKPHKQTQEEIASEFIHLLDLKRNSATKSKQLIDDKKGRGRIV